MDGARAESGGVWKMWGEAVETIPRGWRKDHMDAFTGAEGRENMREMAS